MPRSSHSATSYFSCNPTGSPHLLQSTSPRWNGSVFTVCPQLRQVVRRWFSPLRWPHLHSQLPMAYSTKSNCETLRKSVIGNTDWNTACKPPSSRSLGSASICRKRSYERFCTSIRFGIWMVAGILEKSNRVRNPLLFDIRILPNFHAQPWLRQNRECEDASGAP